MPPVPNTKQQGKRPGGPRSKGPRNLKHKSASTQQNSNNKAAPAVDSNLSIPTVEEVEATILNDSSSVEHKSTSRVVTPDNIPNKNSPDRRSNIRCRYGARCKSKHCKFKHWPGEKDDGSVPSVPEKKKQPKAAPNLEKPTPTIPPSSTTSTITAQPAFTSTDGAAAATHIDLNGIHGLNGFVASGGGGGGVVKHVSEDMVLGVLEDSSSEGAPEILPSSTTATTTSATIPVPATMHQPPISTADQEIQMALQLSTEQQRHHKEMMRIQDLLLAEEDRHKAENLRIKSQFGGSNGHATAATAAVAPPTKTQKQIKQDQEEEKRREKARAKREEKKKRQAEEKRRLQAEEKEAAEVRRQEEARVEEEARQLRLKQEKEDEMRRQEEAERVRRLEEELRVQEEEDRLEEERQKQIQAANAKEDEERRRLKREAKKKRQAEDQAKKQEEALLREKEEAERLIKERDEKLERELEAREEEERQKKLRWQEELRRQKAVAEAKKKEKLSKKAERHQRALEEAEQKEKKRAQFWQTLIESETKYTNLIASLCAAEFVRQIRKDPKGNPYWKWTQVIDEARDKLEASARFAYQVLFSKENPTRVEIAGWNQDLDGRHGSILHWDEFKQKFNVELDTKKNKPSQSMLVKPAHLQPLPDVQKKKKDKYSEDVAHYVSIPNLWKGYDLEYCLVEKETVLKMEKLDSLEDFLDALMVKRDYEEKQRQEQEAEWARQEEEARQRRAEQRRKEQEEYEARRREYEERKHKYEEWRKQERREHQERQARSGPFGFSFGGGARGRARHGNYCRCPACEFEHMFAERLFEEFFSRFYEFDSDEEYDSDDWDRRWDRANEEDRAAKNAEYAELLGVSEDAGPDIIKREYRRKALKYHPDKWSEDHEDGLSKEESEEHFKHIQNAYDHLMSNFDD